MKYVEVNGATIAAGDLVGIPDRVAREVIRRMSAIVYDGAEEGARSHTRSGGTGALLQSLYNRELDGGLARAVGHDGSRAPHALFVHFGARPHEIKPKTRKALRWVAPGGRFAFATRVNHPGYVGDPYLWRAADEAVRQMANIVDAALKGA